MIRYFIRKSIKGFVKPGHKYIRRTGQSGSYLYEYAEMDIHKQPGKTKTEIVKNTAEEVLRAIKCLADRCDYANSLDGAGFNKFDADFGHDLAGRESLSEGQKLAALKMLRKYKTQLGNAGIKLDFSEDIGVKSDEGADADADILLSPYNDKGYSILFDFKWNDPKWIALKDAVKSAGAVYDSNKKVWHINDEDLPKLFDKVDKIAITNEAKSMIANKDKRLAKVQIEEQKKRENVMTEVKKKIVEGEKTEKKTARDREEFIKNLAKQHPENVAMANMLWIDKAGNAHFEKPKRSIEKFEDAWELYEFFQAKQRILLRGNKPDSWIINDLTKRAKNLIQDKKVKVTNKEIDLKIFTKPINEITKEDCLQILAYAKKTGMLREATRGDKKGKICIEKKNADRWHSVSEIDKKISGILSEVVGWNNDSLALPRRDLAPWWFKEGKPEKGFKDEYNKHEYIYTKKLWEMIQDYNAGKGDINVKQIFGNEVKDDKTLKEQLKEIKQTSGEIDILKGKALKAFNDPSPVDVPGIRPGINLWTHQKKYLSWMLAAGKGVVGADTGLGKTFVTLAYLKKMQIERKIDGGLLFLPGAVMYSWEPEIKEKFNGKAKVLYIDGTITQKIQAIKRLKKEKFDLVICSHGLAGGATGGTQYPLFKKVMESTGNYALIYDEAHKGLLKQGNNAWKNIHNLAKQKHQFLLTGTPARNGCEDVKNLIDLLYPGVLGSTKAFNNKYTKKVNNILIPKDGDLMWNELKPFCPVMSKYSQQVDVKLPKAIFTTEKLKAEDDQEEYVEASQNAAIQALLSVKDPNHMTREESNHIFAILGNERRAAFDPRMINKSYTGSAAMIDRTIELIKDKMLYTPTAGDKKKKPGGSIIVSSFIQPFPVYKQMLKDRLGLEDSDIAVITGGVDKKKRPLIENDVNSGKTKVLLMGIGSGGVGLNFQKGADSVFVISDPWTYADKKQAIDRIVRPGSMSDRVYITDYEFLGTGASAGISAFVRKKIEVKRQMHESADIEALIKQIGETSTFDDYMAALGLTREKYNQMRKQNKVKKSIRYFIKSRIAL